MRTWRSALFLASLAFSACSGDDDDETIGARDAGFSRDSGVAVGTDGGDDAGSDAGSRDGGPSDAGASDAGAADGGTADAGTRDGGPAGPCTFEESFPSDGAAWPAAWTEAGGISVSDVVSGAGRFLPTKMTDPYSLGRMATTAGCPFVEAEATFSFRFTQPGTQGIGFYLRSNGGFLQHSTPPGQGYGVFLENFRDRRIGIWREVDGFEIETEVPMAAPVEIDVDYRVRFRVEQIDASSTRLSARMWADGTTEPTEWDVVAIDATPQLQNIGGGIVLDTYSTYVPGDGQTPADLFIDDIRVVTLP